MTSLGKSAGPTADELLKAANEAAVYTRSATATFVATLLYIATTNAGASHETIALERELPLPLLNVSLPFGSFYLAAPALLIGFHLFVLLQEVFLLTKLEAIRCEPLVADGRGLMLTSSLSPNLMFGRRHARSILVILWVAFLAIYIILPLLVLVLIQYKLLPYHSVGLTRWHRVAVVVDLVIIWKFFFVLRRDEISRGSARRRLIPLLAVTFFFLAVSNLAFRLSQPRWGIAKPLISRLPSVPRTLRLRGALLVRPGSNDGQVTSIGTESIGLDFRGRWLEGADFSGATLRRAKFTGASMRNVVLENAHLEGADLEGANLENANLRGASLTGANLARANLDGADCFKCGLQGANLEGASLLATNLVRADLIGASLEWADAKWAQMTEAILIFSKLDGVDLVGADLRFARLQGAEGIRLSRIDLRGAEVAGVRLCDVGEKALVGEEAPFPEEVDFRGVNGASAWDKQEAHEMATRLIGLNGWAEEARKRLGNTMPLQEACLFPTGQGVSEERKAKLIYTERDLGEGVLPRVLKKEGGRDVKGLYERDAKEFVRLACSRKRFARALLRKMEGSLVPRNKELGAALHVQVIEALQEWQAKKCYGLRLLSPEDLKEMLREDEGDGEE